jgi:hypothetical protein
MSFGAFVLALDWDGWTRFGSAPMELMALGSRDAQ